MNSELFVDKIIEIENRIYEPQELQKGEYDLQAAKYDKLISNEVYNKIMWGNSPKDYADFCKKGLKNTNGITISEKNVKGGMIYISGKKNA